METNRKRTKNQITQKNIMNIGSKTSKSRNKKSKKLTAPLIIDVVTVPKVKKRELILASYLKKFPKLQIKQIYISLIILGLIFIAVVIGSLVLGLGHQAPNNQPSLSQTEINLVNFPIYYPFTLPTGYSINSKATKVQTNLLFIRIVHHNQTINISEQPTPLNVPQINKLPSYETLKTSIGQGVIGINYGTPSAIIISQGTLINIDTQSLVSKASLIKIIQYLKPLNNLPTN